MKDDIQTVVSVLRRFFLPGSIGAIVASTFFLIGGCRCAPANAQKATNEKQFVVLFNSLKRGQTQKEVTTLLGKPSEIVPVNISTNMVCDTLPADLWYYRIGENIYMLRFSPPGLSHATNHLQWQIDLKGYPAAEQQAICEPGPALKNQESGR